MTPGKQQGRRKLTKDERAMTLLQALELRRMGVSFGDITRTVNADMEVRFRSAASVPAPIPETKLRNMVLDALGGAVRESLYEFRALEMERLDALYQKAYIEATTGGKQLNTKAIEACLKIHDRRMFLAGLDRERNAAMNDARTTRGQEPQSLESGAETTGDLYGRYGGVRDLELAERILDAEFREESEGKVE